MKIRMLAVALTLVSVVSPPASPAVAGQPVAGMDAEVAPDPAADAARDTYTNPATGDFGPVAPDPSVIRGRDGFWYGYATVAKLPGDPQHRHQLPIIRSRDLVNWQYVGDVFDDDNWPGWAGAGRSLWAPEAKYFDGRYHLYYTVVNAVSFERPNYAIGVASAPTPAGPWTDSGAPVVAPRWWEPFPDQRRPMTVIDPEMVTTPTGERYLYYGSFQGGLFAVRLSADGLHTIGETTKIASEYRFEGSYVVHRDGYYYLLASAAGCCQGPVTGYTVYVARSRDPLGPFIDRYGVPILGPRAGGTPVLAPNGNRWVGTGHNTIATDLSGQDWMVYHAYDRHDPYLGPPVPHRRALLVDRLDWVDGWPVVRAGRFASDGPQPVPAVDALLDDPFEAAGVGDAWRPVDGWQVRGEPAGGYLHADPGERMLPATRAVQGDLRMRGAVRLGAGDGDTAGFALADDGAGGFVRAYLDGAAGELVVAADRGGDQRRRVASLPADFAYPDWHELEVTIRDGRVVASVSDAGLYDPVAQAALDLPPGLAGGRFALRATGSGADFDDVTVARLYEPVRGRVPDPVPGQLDPTASDEFDGAVAPEWSWVRDPAASVSGGQLVFPTQDPGFYRDGNEASLLIRDVPQQAWMVETKVDLEFGGALIDGTPQAGIFAYVNDDLYVRLMKVGHGLTRRTELVKEMPFDGGLVAGSAWIGPPGADSTWLRLSHHVDSATGEHVLRAGTSPDGEHWTWGAAYTLPADSHIRLALGAFGGAGHVARFDYVRLYR